jgi:hypothetical protein
MIIILGKHVILIFSFSLVIIIIIIIIIIVINSDTTNQSTKKGERANAPHYESRAPTNPKKNKR